MLKQVSQARRKEGLIARVELFECDGHGVRLFSKQIALR
jgi:hypothetical protein